MYSYTHGGIICDHNLSQILKDIHYVQESLENMWDQVHGVQKIIAPIIANATDGVNLICYSQGIHNLTSIDLNCETGTLFI